MIHIVETYIINIVVILIKNIFVGALMFYIKKKSHTIDTIIEFINYNKYRGYFMNNMYDNNAI